MRALGNAADAATKGNVLRYAFGQGLIGVVDLLGDEVLKELLPPLLNPFKKSLPANSARSPRKHPLKLLRNL